jgi:outer membrane protein OmpA-like peptidoglycan-associated protein
MAPFRTLVLAGIALPLAALALPDAAFAQLNQGPAMCRPGPDGQPPVLTPDNRVKCAESAVDRAQRQLDRAKQRGEDTADAEQKLADAQAELKAAQEALAAAPPPAQDTTSNEKPQDNGTASDQTQNNGTSETQNDGTAGDTGKPQGPKKFGKPQVTDNSGQQGESGQSSSQQDSGTPPPPKQDAGNPPPPPPQQQASTTPADQQQGSTLELQLQKQGDADELNRVNKLRNKIRIGKPPQNNAGSGNQPPQQNAGSGNKPGGDGTTPIGPVVRQSGDRTIINLGGQIVIQQNPDEETGRLLLGAKDANVERLPNGYSRATIIRDDGTKIVTTRDANGQVVKRVRIDRRGKEFVMIDDTGYQKGPGSKPRGPGQYRFDKDLPPVRVTIPRDQYVVESRRASRRQLEQALMAPPIERVERVYSLDEVRYSQRLRAKMRRIDVDTITFDFGSAAISPSQFPALQALGEAMQDYLAQNPWATILVEGHTDAVGSDYANLLLSDRRAESVAIALTTYFDIPPENLVTQGYGEQFLKVDTQLPERLNRRVALVNITGLVQNDYD